MRYGLFVFALACFAQPPGHLSNLKQLTHGGQNAEAYWSPDGSKFIFQSTRDGAQCDQIYIMNADGSNQHMVSTGKGVTTCGYFMPDSKHFVYASTHEAGPLVPLRRIAARATCGPFMRDSIFTSPTNRARSRRS
ncbi:MAG: hypothetical protein WDO18_14960 [Acidobacteriota bacterium]